MNPPFLTADQSFFMGKCQSCRHAWEEKGYMSHSVWLVCHECEAAEPMTVKPHHTCPMYEYEPGSLG